MRKTTESESCWVQFHDAIVKGKLERCRQLLTATACNTKRCLGSLSPAQRLRHLDSIAFSKLRTTSLHMAALYRYRPGNGPLRHSVTHVYTGHSVTASHVNTGHSVTASHTSIRATPSLLHTRQYGPLRHSITHVNTGHSVTASHTSIRATPSQHHAHQYGPLRHSITHISHDIIIIK